MPNLSNVMRLALSGLLLTISLAASAKADTKENLVFTGTATCGNADCSSYGSGPLTGTYTLDVTTQTIVGAWSFTGPFGVVSSSESGALASVTDRLGDINPGFSESGGIVSFVQFFFPSTDPQEIGALAINVNSDACIYTGPDSCDPDYILTGTTALAAATPEPGTGGLMLIGATLLLALRKR